MLRVLFASDLLGCHTEGRREKELESGWPVRTCVSMVQTNDADDSDMKAK